MNQTGNGTNEAGGVSAQELRERVGDLGNQAQQLWSDARGTFTDVRDTLDLQGRVDRNPYGMILAAVGVGYVLGGGLFTSTTARLLRLGVRLAALPLVKDELLTMAHGAAEGFRQARQQQGGNPNA